MLQLGTALKVTIHLNQDTGATSGFLAADIVAFLQRSGIEGATALHAYSGFGRHRQLHTSGAGDAAGEHLPVQIYFIDTPERVHAILPKLLAMVTDGLVEAHPTEILKNISTEAKVIS